MKHLILALDLGTSLTKCLYQVDDGPLRLLTVPPDAVELSRTLESVVTTQCDAIDAFRSAGAENLIWYTPTKDSSRLFVAGSLASKFQEGVDIKQLKYEVAEFKIVGIVGVIAQRERFGNERFLLDIALLLPHGEYRDGEQLKDQVARVLSGRDGFYWHGTQSVRAKLGEWRFYPEGSGRIFRYMQKEGKAAVRSHNLLILMLGHRNGSILALEQGRDSEESESSDKYGFYRFLEYILEVKSGYSPEDLMKGITAQDSNGDGTRYFIDPRKVAELRNRNSDNIEREAAEIQAAIEAAHLRYINGITRWIESKQRVFNADKFLFCGGACLLFREELEAFAISDGRPDPVGVFTESIDPEQDPAVEELSTELHLSHHDRQTLGYRLVDIYSLFKDVTSKERQYG